MLQRLRGINKVQRRLANGKVSVHYYYRATGAKLNGEPNSPEFRQSYVDAERAARERTARGTLSSLIRQFQDSPEYTALAESTRVEYRRKFTKIEAEFGDCPIGGLIDPEFRTDVMEWRDEIAKKTRREADNLVDAIGRVLSYAVDRAKIRTNVLANIKSVYKSNRADKIWLPEHITAFMKVAKPEIGRAMVLALHTGQRQGDLRKLTWAAYDGTRLTLKQGKGKKDVSIKCTKAVKQVLDDIQAERDIIQPSDTILTSGTGRPWLKRNFAARWQEVTEAAGITDLHFHDLRGTAVTMLAEAGCTVPEIASVTGHSLATAQKILEVYLSRTKALSDAAIFKFERRSRQQSRLQKHQ